MKKILIPNPKEFNFILENEKIDKYHEKFKASTKFKG